jgi:hypothetical protein
MEESQVDQEAHMDEEAHVEQEAPVARGLRMVVRNRRRVHHRGRPVAAGQLQDS